MNIGCLRATVMAKNLAWEEMEAMGWSWVKEMYMHVTFEHFYFIFAITKYDLLFSCRWCKNGEMRSWKGKGARQRLIKRACKLNVEFWWKCGIWPHAKIGIAMRIKMMCNAFFSFIYMSFGPILLCTDMLMWLGSIFVVDYTCWS